MKHWHPRFLLSLIGLSLLLLLGLELAWLQQVYQGQTTQLETEVDRILTRTVQSVQDSLIQAFLQEPEKWLAADRPMPPTSDTLIRFELGSLSVRKEGIEGPRGQKRPSRSIVIQSTITDSFPGGLLGDSVSPALSRTVRKRLTGSGDEADRSDKVSGALSVFIQVEDQRKPQTQLQQLIQQRFRRDEDLQALGLPILVVPAEDSALAAGHLLVTERFTDIPSGQTLVAGVEASPAYLLGNMWPELLFACVLLGLITLAFGLIYRAYGRQRRLTQLKQDFISNITHELKTPITTVQAAIEALRHFDALQDPARTREYLSISQQQLNHLDMLVERVLNISLLERNRLHLQIEAVDLHKLMLEVLAALQFQVQKAFATVNLHVEGQDFTLWGDQLHLRSVMVNLLDNALKYSREQPHIQLDLWETPDHLLLSVRDEGIGIPAMYQGKVFEQFFRVPTGNRHDVKGHGLGLSYVAEVIRHHQGQIELSSVEGSGSTFSISLPKQISRTIA